MPYNSQRRSLTPSVGHRAASGSNRRAIPRTDAVTRTPWPTPASGKLDWSKAKKADEKSKPKVKKEDTSSDVKVKEKSESPVPPPKVKAKASVKHEDSGSPKDESKVERFSYQ